MGNTESQTLLGDIFFNLLPIKIVLDGEKEKFKYLFGVF